MLPSIITLIPEKQNPYSMGEFRPNSCCNVVYKCITKILVNRLVLPGLDSIVSNSQTAFVPNRSISENVLLTKELVRDIYTKDKGELDAHPK